MHSRKQKHIHYIRLPLKSHLHLPQTALRFFAVRRRQRRTQPLLEVALYLALARFSRTRGPSAIVG